MIVYDFLKPFPCEGIASTGLRWVYFGCCVVRVVFLALIASGILNV